MQVTSHQFSTIKDACDYALAGNATLTLESLKTGAHFTFKVRLAKPRDGEEPQALWFVSLLNGPDNGSDYQYLGIIRNGRFTRTAKSRITEEASSFKAFNFFWACITAGKLPESLAVRHEGRCGRCGRVLTVPESIDAGIGPECANKLGGDL